MAYCKTITEFLIELFLNFIDLTQFVAAKSVLPKFEVHSLSGKAVGILLLAILMALNKVFNNVC